MAVYNSERIYRVVYCKGCGKERIAEDTKACTDCGIRGWLFTLVLESSLTPHSFLDAKALHSNSRKWFARSKVGSSFYTLTGRWHRLERFINRASNWYYEHITDAETGEIVRHDEGKLTDHTGHGSAKK